MEKLLYLSRDGVGSFCVFPLEQLISFELLFDNGTFELSQDRFLSLQRLRLNYGNSFSLSTHGLALKGLRSLSLSNYNVVNLSGLNQLTTLTVRSVRTLLGKEEIFPRLKTLNGDKYFVHEGVRDYLQLNELVVSDPSVPLTVDQLNQCLQFPSVRICGKCSLTNEDLILGEKLKSLELAIGGSVPFGGVSPGRYFDEIKLHHHSSLQDTSMFSHDQKVYLWNCFSILDIHSLRNVPYLVIIGCHGIEDYSCLGAQHYLEIGNTYNLLDEHVCNFGQVRYLKISDASGITRTDRLTHNRFIEIIGCQSLCTAVFYGIDYIKVIFVGCFELGSVSIHGRIYLLYVHACSALSRQSIKNCTYIRRDP
jgi:hypothetical protein